MTRPYPFLCQKRTRIRLSVSSLLPSLSLVSLPFPLAASIAHYTANQFETDYMNRNASSAATEMAHV